MRFEATPIEGCYEIHLEPHTDERGAFARRFSRALFEARGLEGDFVERSLSRNRRRGTLRGLHFQAEPHGETKLVRCTRGAAYDVMADLRRGSATFGRWHGVVLTAEAGNLVYIPRGFAHGFQTLADETEIDYEITPGYQTGASRGIRYDDPDLGIEWPLPAIALSERDLRLPFLAAAILPDDEDAEPARERPDADVA